MREYMFPQNSNELDSSENSSEFEMSVIAFALSPTETRLYLQAIIDEDGSAIINTRERILFLQCCLKFPSNYFYT